MRLHPFLALGTAALLAGCPGGAPTASSSTGMPPSSAPSPAPWDSATPGPQATATPSPAPSVARIFIKGLIYDDEGRLMQNARVQVSSAEDPSLNRTVDAPGGAYVVTGVPVGTVIAISAQADGYTTRTRTVRARTQPVDVDEDVNQTNFGGLKKGAYYALSRYPEIASVTPANKAVGVSPRPLVITFRFSQPINEKGRSAFSRMLQVRFPTRGTPSEALITVGTEYDNKEAALSWNDAGTEATFRFDAPIVSGGAAAALTVDFDDTPVKDWPQGTNGLRLGNAVCEAVDALGGTVGGAFAPFVREDIPEAKDDLEAVTPLEIWGKSHQTAIRFSLAQEPTPFKLLSVQPATGTDMDRFVLTFDRPMRGFPESALDPVTLQASNYRFVLGKNDTGDNRAEFERMTPDADGRVPDKVSYHSLDPNKLVLQLPAGTLKAYHQYKLQVTPAIKDITGATLSTSGGATNYFEGKL